MNTNPNLNPSLSPTDNLLMGIGAESTLAKAQAREHTMDDLRAAAHLVGSIGPRDWSIHTGEMILELVHTHAPTNASLGVLFAATAILADLRALAWALEDGTFTDAA